jgi:hypothetical protein
MESRNSGLVEQIEVLGEPVEVTWHLDISRSLANPFMGVASVSWSFRKRGNFLCLCDFTNDQGLVPEDAPLKFDLTEEIRSVVMPLVIDQATRLVLAGVAEGTAPH